MTTAGPLVPHSLIHPPGNLLVRSIDNRRSRSETDVGKNDREAGFRCGLRQNPQDLVRECIEILRVAWGFPPEPRVEKKLLSCNTYMYWFEEVDHPSLIPDPTLGNSPG